MDDPYYVSVVEITKELFSDVEDKIAEFKEKNSDLNCMSNKFSNNWGPFERYFVL